MKTFVLLEGKAAHVISRYDPDKLKGRTKYLFTLEGSPPKTIVFETGEYLPLGGAEMGICLFVPAAELKDTRGAIAACRTLEELRAEVRRDRPRPTAA